MLFRSGSVTLSVTASVSGLTNGTAYTFRAASKIGSTWSGYSASSPFATPTAPAAGPENLTVDVPSGSPYLRVTWDGGATQSAANTPSGYDLEKSSDDGVTWTPAGSWLMPQEQAQQMFVWGYGYVRPNDNISAATGSFLPSTAYKFRLRRTRYRPGIPPSLVGAPILPASAWATTVAAVTTPSSPPGPPRGLSAEPFLGGVAVSFVEPYFPGSSAVTSYRVYVLPAGSSVSGASPSATVTAADSASTIFRINESVGYDVKRAVVTGLTNGQAYSVWVGGVNPAGETIAGPVAATPQASMGQQLELTAEPYISGCTRPSGEDWGQMVLKVSKQGYVSWGSGAALLEVQCQRRSTISIVPQWGGGGVDTGPSQPQFRDSRWFDSVTSELGWTWWPFGGTEATFTHVRMIIEYSPTGIRGPSLTTGVPYVFRVRPVRGSVAGPWSYATASTN